MCRRRAAWRAAIAAIAIGALSPSIPGTAPLFAGEATARGRKADITWIDEKGQTQTAAARLIRYNYWNRVYLSAPRGGKNFKDEAHEEAGLPLAGRFIKLTQVDRIDFAWKSDPGSGLTRLEITVTLADGKVVTAGGASLAGASHPLSPWISFTVDGAPHRIDLEPLSSESDRAGKPRIVTIQVTL
jgi:hypothetical protein